MQFKDPSITKCQNSSEESVETNLRSTPTDGKFFLQKPLMSLLFKMSNFVVSVKKSIYSCNNSC